MSFEIKRLSEENAAAVAEIEKICFSHPWSEKTVASEMTKGLDGTPAVAFGQDEVGAATILYKAIKDFGIMEAKFGVVNGEVVDTAQIEALSKTPSKETLIAMLLGMLNAPVAALARALDAIAKKEA